MQLQNKRTIALLTQTREFDLASLLHIDLTLFLLAHHNSGCESHWPIRNLCQRAVPGNVSVKCALFNEDLLMTSS